MKENPRGKLGCLWLLCVLGFYQRVWRVSIKFVFVVKGFERIQRWKLPLAFDQLNYTSDFEEASKHQPNTLFEGLKQKGKQKHQSQRKKHSKNIEHPLSIFSVWPLKRNTTPLPLNIIEKMVKFWPRKMKIKMNMYLLTYQKTLKNVWRPIKVRNLHNWCVQRFFQHPFPLAVKRSSP